LASACRKSLLYQYPVGLRGQARELEIGRIDRIFGQRLSEMVQSGLVVCLGKVHQGQDRGAAFQVVALAGGEE